MIKASHFRILALTLAAVLLSFLAFASASASAQEKYLFTGSFGAATTSPANSYPISESASLAVDETTHDVYVADIYNYRIEKFDSVGNFILMFGKSVDRTKVEEGATEAEQNVCTAASGDVCQPGSAGNSPGAFEPGKQGQFSIAVDNSSTSDQGDVYVADGGDNLVSKFDSQGKVVGSWGDNGPLGEPNGQLKGTAASRTFAGLDGVAVGSTGTLVVIDGTPNNSPPHTVFEFRQDGQFLTDWEVVASATYGGIGVDANEHIFIESGYSEPYRFSTGAKYGEGVGHPGNTTTGFAVDPRASQLFILNAAFSQPTKIERVSTTCLPVKVEPETDPENGCHTLETFGANRLGVNVYDFGLAVDGEALTRSVYVGTHVEGGENQVSRFSLLPVPTPVTEKPAAVAPGSATLAATVNPSGQPLTGCFFEWGEHGAGEPEPYGHTAECEPGAAAVGAGSSPVDVTAHLAGLEPGHTYHYRLVASNVFTDTAEEPQQGEDLAFGPPRIDSASATDVSATAATLQAEINPQNVTSEYHFQYLPETLLQKNEEEGEPPFQGAAEAPVQPGSLGAVSNDIKVSQPLHGLVPHTVYAYRVLAANPLGEALGEALTLTTQPVSPFSLPDSRQWELVSPPDKHGALIETLGEAHVTQAAVGGDAVTYVTSAPTEAEPEGYANFVQVLSSRGPGGWFSRDISSPHDSAPGTTAGYGGAQEYRLFSADLSLSALNPFGAFTPSISAEATEGSAFLHTDYLGRPSAFCTSECFHPFVTGAEGFANVPAGTVFGYGCSLAHTCGPEVFDATPDLSHAVLGSKVALTSAPIHSEALYEWSAGAPPEEQLRPISVLPNGAVVPGSLGYIREDLKNAISVDGSRVVWSSGNSQNSHLYLRYNATEPQSVIDGSGHCSEPELACSLQIDTVQGGSGEGTVEPRFLWASADDSRIFFKDHQQLTSDASKGGEDLYVCEVVEEAGGPSCHLTDLTAERSGQPGGFLGSSISGVSEDGSFAYFASNGALTEGSEPGDCLNETHDAAAQSCGLFLTRRQGDEWTTQRLATLSEADFGAWGDGTYGRTTTRVSPDGRWLAFMSERPLTGYDNRDALTGKRDFEVFLYHAAPNAGEAGTLVCASCNPTGARPHGVELAKVDPGALGVKWRLEVARPDAGLAGALPTWTSYQGQGVGSIHQPAYLSDSGRLFFDSSDALVSQDVNGTGDVYEYEPASVGDCTTSLPTYSERSAGCVDLISSGTSSRESNFMDASENGNDVFFYTSARLTGEDRDSARDIYDAHVCEPESPCPASPTPPPVECEGDGCQQPATPPSDPTPGSLTFNGPGNPHEARPRKHPKRHKNKKPHHKRAASQRRGAHK